MDSPSSPANPWNDTLVPAIAPEVDAFNTLAAVLDEVDGDFPHDLAACAKRAAELIRVPADKHNPTIADAKRHLLRTLMRGGSHQPDALLKTAQAFEALCRAETADGAPALDNG